MDIKLFLVQHILALKYTFGVTIRYLGFYGWCFFLGICIPWTIEAQPILDSIEIWKQRQNLKAICQTARNLEDKHASLAGCSKIKVLLAASKASRDLYKFKDCLSFARAARRISYSECPDSTLLMEVILQEAIGLNTSEDPEKEKAISYTEQVIRFGERHSKTELRINAYTNLGIMLNKSKEFEKAKALFLKVSKLLPNISDPRQEAINYANLALCDLNLEQYSSGNENINFAIHIAIQIDYTPLLAHCYGLKYNLQKGLGNEAAMLAALDSSILISKKIGNTNQTAMGMAERVTFLLDKKHFEEAIQSGIEALKILEKDNWLPLETRFVYAEMYKAYLAIGDLSNAIRYQEKYVSLNDSISNSDFQKQVYELNLKYEVQEKDNRLLQQQLELKTSKMLLLGASASIALLFIIAFFISWRNRYHKLVISTLFQKEREMEREILKLRSLFPNDKTESSNTKVVGAGEHIFQQLYLSACNIMETQQLFLNPEFELKELVQILGTNRKYLSQAINQYTDDGFRSYLTRYRVQHAKTILWDIASNKYHIPLGEVWKHSGLNSNSGFYRVFKTVTGLTPLEYLDQVKMELSKKQTISEFFQEDKEM